MHQVRNESVNHNGLSVEDIMKLWLFSSWSRIDWVNEKMMRCNNDGKDRTFPQGWETGGDGFRAKRLLSKFRRFNGGANGLGVASIVYRLHLVLTTSPHTFNFYDLRCMS